MDDTRDDYFGRAWEILEDAYDHRTVVEAPVIRAAKKGLILDFYGLEAFLPKNLIHRRHVGSLNQFVGQWLGCQVIELDRSRREVVLSRIVVLEEESREERQRFFEELSEGDIIEGTVSSLIDFGVFVDLEGIDGLIHISELSSHPVDHPSEVVQVGEKVRARVLEIDPERERVSLTLRQEVI